MQPVEIKPSVYWVGAVDWDIRDFHGYLTPRGTTYNAYLITGGKNVLVDTVKQTHFGEMLSRIGQLVDPGRIDCIVANHVEMDHSGSLPLLLEIAPRAEVITSPQGEKGLSRHYKKDWPFKTVKTGETLDLGGRTLQFFHVPMVHWPDSMVTYLAEEKLLLSNDAFGQHIADSRRFDSEVGWDILREEAAKYYANIVMPYGENVKKALAALSGLEIEVIAPSHGMIWRRYLPEIFSCYRKWSGYQADQKAVIVYDTMWGSTRKIARALQEGLEEAGIPVSMRSLKDNHISTVMPDVLEAKAVLIGSPTLNNGLFSTVGAFLTYLKGLRPRQKIGFAFGSYGWGGQAVKEIEEVMNALGWRRPLTGINIQYLPGAEELARVKETGKKLGEIILQEN
ncbi:MAG TPA: FprA family A-type flavoprotein [Bacillota bacterium]|nr:FprA family A-type flavoprotein [Bacillota bacterium]